MPTPSTVEDAAALVRELGAAGTAVRPVGAGTRAGWAGRDPGPVVPLSSGGLRRIVAHNPGDLTAVLEAGVPLAEAQEVFAAAGQWLAVDPPDDPSGTLGGLVATADSGPSRHRHGGLRDLLIGVTVVLSDGVVASSGGTVIKNVAGYDLAKLFTGSYGTLGFITSLAVRLHPRPAHTVTVTGGTADPDLLGRTAGMLAARPLEALCLDAWWAGDVGGVLVRFGGVAAAEQASRTTPLLAALDDVAVIGDDEPLWAAQRARQRRPDGAVLKVSARPTDLPRVITAARSAGAALVSRAALGLSWLTFAPAPPGGTVPDQVDPGVDLAARIAAVRRDLAPRAGTVLDGAALVAEPWPAVEPGLLALNGRVKARFDPARIFRPGAFVGGI